jgi:hypothetical protein
LEHNVAKEHSRFVCLKPLDGFYGKQRKCAVKGLRGVPEEKIGRFARRCEVKQVGLAFGRWKGIDGKKRVGWAVTHHGKAMTQPVKSKEEALKSLGEYMEKLLGECSSCE